MATRQEAFEAINGERGYQAALWGEKPHTITEFLGYIRDYTEEALHTTCRQADVVANPKALAIIRKLGALAVACMEQHGAPERDWGDLAKSMELHAVEPLVIAARTE